MFHIALVHFVERWIIKMKKKIKTIVVLIICIAIGIVAVKYLNNTLKERKIVWRKTILQDIGITTYDESIFEDEDSFLKALETINYISIDKLDENNHERIEYAINHMPMLRNINIYFNSSDYHYEYEDDVNLKYFNDFTF